MDDNWICLLRETRKRGRVEEMFNLKYLTRIEVQYFSLADTSLEFEPLPLMEGLDSPDAVRGFRLWFSSENGYIDVHPIIDSETCDRLSEFYFKVRPDRMRHAFS